jgi:16S rRNA (adenine1518-N6/adenine1519-N6)-dimethyltransferase
MILKKSLGQHFLHDQSICKQIVAFVDTNQPNWLEVGPGGGAITQYLLQLPLQQFCAIEIDDEKVQHLLKTYPQLQGKLLHQDILHAPPPYPDAFNIIGNFPYNISTQIIFQVLEWRLQVHSVIGMFQKEVAIRFASKHGSKDYGITSVITQSYYDIEYLLDVPPSAFTPPPKVDSGVIRLINNNNPYQIADYKKYKTFIKAAFSQRRKTLRNALKSILPPEKLQDDLFGKRAEQLSVAQFAALYKSFYEA